MWQNTYKMGPKLFTHICKNYLVGQGSGGGITDGILWHNISDMEALISIHWLGGISLCVCVELLRTAI